MTVRDLASEFDRNYMQRRLRETTINGYLVNLNNHVLPIVGHLPLDQLHVSHLDQITDELQDKGLSNKSIVYCHATTRKMLNYALKRGYIAGNPYAMFDLPRIHQYRYTVISPEQIAQLADAARDRCPDLYPAIVLAGYYGMRRGGSARRDPVPGLSRRCSIGRAYQNGYWQPNDHYTLQDRSLPASAPDRSGTPRDLRLLPYRCLFGRVLSGCP